MIIPDVIEQHWEEAGILWARRCSATARASFGLRSLSQLDERVEAHLDGLRIAGKEGWELCLGAAAWEDGGEAFVMGMLSCADADEARFNEVRQHAVASPALARGLTSALGWLDASPAQSKIHALLIAESPVERRIGLGAAAVHRLRMDGPLTNALKDTDELLRARACKAAGELGRSDLTQQVQSCLAAGKEEACVFWAAWSLAIFGSERAALERLTGFATTVGPWQYRAADILFRRWGQSAAMDFQRQFSSNPEHARLAVMAAGMIGDPGLVPWLLDQMANPERVRLAAEAFQTITGADFVMDRLRNSTPPRPPVMEDSGVDQPSDADDDLTWPEPKALREWWMRRREHFTTGTRYFLGKPITIERLQEVLRTGHQRQRASAALELAIRQPGQALFNVSAPGFRQQAMLAAGTGRP